MDAIEFLTDTLALRGSKQYGMERVSQLEHGLQCAALAGAEVADPALVIAALLHDIGHMLHGLDPDGGRRGVDDRHEVTGAALIGRWFGPEVVEPIRLHVPAKRYLCAVEPVYYEGLSEASRRSLAVQGNPFTPAEADRFIRLPFAADAVRLRRWDDRAKVTGLEVPRLTHYRPYLKRLLCTGTDTAKAS